MKRGGAGYLLVFVILALIPLSSCAPPPYRAPRYKPPPSKGQPPTQRPYEIFGETYYPLPSADGYVEEGLASWYGPDFHSKATACGEVYDMYDHTAAHKILPMQTYVRVLNIENGLDTVVRINDRGPFVKGRVIDLSLAAAREIGIYANGTSYVRLQALGMPTEVFENGRKVTRFVSGNYAVGDFWIQVGAFTQKENAERLKNDLLKSRAKVELEPYDRGDMLFYRVQVFASTDLDKARALEREFSSAYPNAFLVAR
ncbi:MAG: septal ring lytic transglycosylase RlpA family protein [Pseudomonadota bacterium]